MARVEAQRIERDLARRSAEHLNLPIAKVVERNVNEIRLLIERGPASWAEPSPVPVEKIDQVIDLLFTKGAQPDRGGFCWADQVRSGSSLRARWDKLVTAPWARDVHRRGSARREMTPAQRTLYNMGMLR